MPLVWVARLLLSSFSGRRSEQLACQEPLGSSRRDLLSRCSRANQSLFLKHLFSSGGGGGGVVGREI